MKIPTLEGVIGRRLLVNFQVSAEVIEALLPAPFRPRLVGSRAVAGICLIRLEAVRPNGFPACVGLASENAAHRVAVEWDESGYTRTGVFIPRRDTSSQLNAWAGDHLFAGQQHLCRFDTEEQLEHIRVALESQDGEVRLEVSGRPTSAWPHDSMFANFEAADEFFRLGSAGYSPTDHPARFSGIELDCPEWRAEPFQVDSVRSSFFDALPPGSAVFDCALLMRNVAHRWRELRPLCC